jgi:hypothetical protein
LPPVNNETCKVRRRINIEHDGWVFIKGSHGFKI